MGEEKWTLYTTIIGVVMVVTGSINTLAAKWADRMYADGRKFDHPFVQAVCMFIGEFCCLPVFFIIYFIRKRRYNSKSELEREFGDGERETHIEPPQSFPRLNPLVFLPASLCDMTATSIMYVGLNLTNPASFQMLRGAVIIFTGLLSVAFLRSTLRAVKWLGMLIVVAGLIVVGLADILYTDHSKDDMNAVISGDLLIIMAQVIAAVQMVYEQKYVTKYNVPPLVAVGIEGFWGMTILSILLIPMYYIKVGPPFSNDPVGRLENALDAFKQIHDNPLIIAALTGTIVSIAFFNFAGISVTKEMSATTRMVLDTVRTIVIWGVSLGLRWQEFIAFQLLGFFFLITGMCVYNDLIFAPVFRAHVIPFLESRNMSIQWLNRCCFPDVQVSFFRLKMESEGLRENMEVAEDDLPSNTPERA